MHNLREKYIGSKAFYAAVAALILPMMVQQGITQFVNLLDNVMVGRLGTEPMSGVAIVNQIVFIFNLTIFGGLSGASIFGAQFYGKKDTEGLRDTFRFRLVFALVVWAIGVAVFLLFGKDLFQLYLHEDASDPEALAATLEYAMSYMRIMLWGLLPFVLVQCCSSVLRDVGETFSPMVASVIAIFVNLVLNYLLIFGKFGFPKMGVAGAALATVISRYLEAAYLIAGTWRRKEQFPFLKGALKSLRVPGDLVKRIAVTGTPLLLNEALWSVGMSAISICYASRGLVAVAATNINATVWNLFSIVIMSTGNAIGIMAGQLLGAGDMEGARDAVRKLLFFAVAANLLVGAVIIALSPVIPKMYNTEPEVRQTATKLLMIAGAVMPFSAYINGAYFTIRSGGKTFITFLFDCVFTWVVCFPVAWCLSHFTGLSVVWIYFFVQSTDLIKITIGAVMIHSGVWLNNVVNEVNKPAEEPQDQPD